MKLTQAERIQLLRRRTGLNQGDFGAQAFDTSYESGRTKVKNIELGKQKPTADDIVKMADVLGVDERELAPLDDKAAEPVTASAGDLVISEAVLKTFPGLKTYLDMLNKAVRIGDAELIAHITGKTAAIFSDYTARSEADATTATKG